MKVAVIGIVGIPGAYGGFETLVENLVKYREKKNLEGEFAVYCSGSKDGSGESRYLGAELRYVNIRANGISSIIYDIAAIFSSLRKRDDVILVLGVSGAIAFPLIRRISKAALITNIDGIEWKRKKWGLVARWFLRLSEKIAVCHSDVVIADNAAIADHIKLSYGKNCQTIAYGGDHAVAATAAPYCSVFPRVYALALCRIEPENNVAMILQAFSESRGMPLVFIGNWNSNKFGRQLKENYKDSSNLFLLDPIYDAGVLKTIRSGASLYVHGHSAGGTNPSLVEMMHFGVPIFAYNCIFNRYSTEDSALFFDDVESLRKLNDAVDENLFIEVGKKMLAVARRRYTWEAVGQAYFDLFSTVGKKNCNNLEQL